MLENNVKEISLLLPFPFTTKWKYFIFFQGQNDGRLVAIKYHCHG